MCHNTIGGTQNNLTELPGWQQIHNPLFDLTHSNVESGGDDTTLVQAAIKFDNDLLGAVVINDLKFTNVSYHDKERVDVRNSENIRGGGMSLKSRRSF